MQKGRNRWFLQRPRITDRGRHAQKGRNKWFQQRPCNKDHGAGGRCGNLAKASGTGEFARNSVKASGTGEIARNQEGPAATGRGPFVSGRYPRFCIGWTQNSKISNSKFWKYIPLFLTLFGLRVRRELIFRGVVRMMRVFDFFGVLLLSIFIILGLHKSDPR